ncbi:MAG: putative aminotransferase/MSMEI [Firmicutes bacterium]|nr:putative aminotransferase/MSMEI [Bacillota bacterium]
MIELQNITTSDLETYHSSLSRKYQDIQNKKLNLDMSRGKPCKEQLDLSNGLLESLDSSDYRSANGTDCRNYGILDGLPELKALCAELLEVQTQEVIVGGNSSLTQMYDLIAKMLLHRLPDSDTPWCKLSKIKFLCPSPGYDRHFAISANFGIEMIPIDYHSDGPDMDTIERLVANDPEIKGIWCVPKYSNPTGITYSDNVVTRLAKMSAKAPDFTIFWDNAYIVHHLDSTHPKLLNILTACREANHPNRVFIFSSTSKISFPGSGIAMLASSEANISWLKKLMSVQSIGPDKINQLRHLRFFKNIAGIEAHMERHAAILSPKFKIVLNILQDNFANDHTISWSKPHGGYFISLDTPPGCAKKVVAKAKAAGVVLTPAGASFPYGNDPEDRNIRIAPTMPSLAELQQAMELLVLCIKLVSAEEELAKRQTAS